MPQPLNLSASRSKLDRAAEHLRAIEGELPGFEDANPYALTLSEIDPESGWCDVWIEGRHLDEPRLSVILGDARYTTCDRHSTTSSQAWWWRAVPL